ELTPDNLAIVDSCPTTFIVGTGLFVECVTEDQDLKDDLYNLLYYAPYNEIGDLFLYASETTGYGLFTNYVSDINNLGSYYRQINLDDSNASQDDLSSYGTVISTGSSLVEAPTGERGIVIHQDGAADYLMYDFSSSPLSGDFVIEMSVRIPDNDKHYLIDAGDNFKVFTQNGELIFYNGTSSSDNNYNIITENFNQIFIKKLGNYIYTRVGNSNFVKSQYLGENMISTENINNIVIGALDILGMYLLQINDIIDYVKIYN
ncbi:MAG: hypothetical protein QM490_00495, partial [Candidatus Gracilibacteria bacterium]